MFSQLIASTTLDFNGGTAPNPAFRQTLAQHQPDLLRRDALTQLQLNLGYRCNQACEHCHVEAGPKREEEMSWGTMQSVLAWIKQAGIEQVDLTGGAPEMNPNFQAFVEALRDSEVAVTSRCNLTILTEPGYTHLTQWYAEQQVRIVASLPCYSEANVEQQRGKGVFGKSIEALQALNAQGYGEDAKLPLTLVYNPIGPSLPPDQKTLETEYRERLKQDFDIVFTDLVTITNLPVKRFKHYLERTDQLTGYMNLLEQNFNPLTLPELMCRSLLSVDWRGYTYDCDFNQMLELPAGCTEDAMARNPSASLLWELDPASLQGAPIVVDDHCYGCTAGAGSSCSGALT